MKKIFIVSILIMALLSCEKEEDKVYISDNPVTPAFTKPTSGKTIVFLPDSASNQLLFIWNKADWGYKTTAIKYVIQVDTPNSVINRPKTVTFTALSSSKSDSAIVSYKDLSTKLLNQFKFPKGIEKTVEVRVRANLENYDTLYSEPLIFKVTLQ